MAQINSNEPNSLEWLEQVQSYTNNLGVTSIQGVEGLTNFIGNRQNDLFGLLDSLVNDVDKPVLKSLMNDMADVLGTFYMDEDVICCLIRNILIQLDLQTKLKKYLTFQL